MSFIADGNATGAIRFALSQLNKPYLWGATGPDSYDCSGLLMTAYQKGSGITIPRTTYAMLDSGQLQRINAGQLQPGDLVFPSREHVQMYLGGGKVIEAPRSGIPVRIANLGTVWQARRVTNPGNGNFASPVSTADPVDDISGSTTITASDVSQAVGVGLTNSFSSVFKVVGEWTVWIGEILIGFAVVIGGAYLIVGKDVTRLVGKVQSL